MIYRYKEKEKEIIAYYIHLFAIILFRDIFSRSQIFKNWNISFVLAIKKMSLLDVHKSKNTRFVVYLCKYTNQFESLETRVYNR